MTFPPKSASTVASPLRRLTRELTLVLTCWLLDVFKSPDIWILILMDSLWTFFRIPFHIIVVIFSVTVAMVTTVVTRISLKSLRVPDPSLGLVSNSLAAPPQLVSLLISLTPHLKHSIMISEQMPWTAIKYGSLLVH